MPNSLWAATQESGVPGSANLPIGALVGGRFSPTSGKCRGTMTGDPCQLVWQVNQLGGQTDAGWPHDPCHLAWQVKETPFSCRIRLHAA